MHNKFLALGLILLCPCLGAETAKRTITHEDVWLMKRVGAPVPSPDGKWAVVLVTSPAYDPKDQAANLWLLSTDGAAPPRQLTQGKSPESGAAWSPDGTRIVFASKRDGDETEQLYVLNVAMSGEAEKVTSLALGARQPKWSPDGRLLLFVSDAYPGCLDEAANKRAAKERSDRKYRAREYETYPIRFWNHWLDDKEAHLFVQEARAGAVARDLFAGSKAAGSPGFGALNTDEGQAIEAEWAPDSASVVFAAAVNRDASTREPVRTQLFSVPAAGGEPVNLTSDGRSYSQPQFSPDNRFLYCKTNEEPADKVYEIERVARFPWPFSAAGRAVVTSMFDRSVGRFAIPSGGERVWFTAEDSGRERLFSVPAGGGETREEKAVETGCLTGLSAGGPSLVASWDSAIHPPEAVAIQADGGPARRLTAFTDETVAALDLAPVESFWFTSSGGKKIHNLFIRPPHFDPVKKYPLLVLIHGGAANMARDAWNLRWNDALLAAPGYGVLWTDYTGSSGYGEKFGQSIQFDPLKGPATEINEAADEALKRFPFLDPARQAAAGASYGGHLANWLEATTTRYKCIVSHAGEADLVMQWGTSDSIYNREVNSGTPVWGDSKVWREQSPMMQGGNQAKGTGFKTPILLTVGEQDFRVPMNNAIAFFAMQQRLQVPSKLIVFPEETHWIVKGEDSRFWYREVQAWLARYL